jgi:hypothetical protein
MRQSVINGFIIIRFDESLYHGSLRLNPSIVALIFLM